MRNGGFTLTPVGEPNNSRTAKHFGMIMERPSKRPILAATVDSTSAIAGKHGAFDFGAKLGPIQFGLECAMITRNAVTLQMAADRLGEFLLDATGSPRQLELVFDLKPGKKYTVRYSGSLDIERIVGLGQFTLPFIAYDPFSYSTDLSTEITWDSEVSMDNEILTFDDGPPVFAVTGPATVEVVNFGAFEVWPLIEIIGSFTKLTIRQGTRALVYNEAVTNNKVTIDCERMQARLAQSNKNNKVSGQFIKLPPGRNIVEIGGTGLNCTVSFVFRAKFT